VWSFNEIKDIVDRFVERTVVEKPAPPEKKDEEDKGKSKPAASEASSGADGVESGPAAGQPGSSVVPKLGEAGGKKKAKASVGRDSAA